MIASLAASALLGGRTLWWLIALLLLLTVFMAYLSVSMMVPVHPDHLVPLREQPAGAWPAMVRAKSFERVIERRPRIEDFAELPGRITFESDRTIVWVMGKSNRMVFGPLERRWQPPYTLSARRLKGIGGQVHLIIRTGPDPAQDVDDIWLHLAKDFPI